MVGNDLAGTDLRRFGHGDLVIEPGCHHHPRRQVLKLPYSGVHHIPHAVYQPDREGRAPRQPELHSLLRNEFRLRRHNGAPGAALRQFVLCPVTPVAVFDVRQHQRLHKSFDKGGFSRADRSHNADIHAAAGTLSHILINRRCLHHNAILRMLSVALFLCAVSVV